MSGYHSVHIGVHNVYKTFIAFYPQCLFEVFVKSITPRVLDEKNILLDFLLLQTQKFTLSLSLSHSLTLTLSLSHSLTLSPESVASWTNFDTICDLIRFAIYWKNEKFVAGRRIFRKKSDLLTYAFFVFQSNGPQLKFNRGESRAALTARGFKFSPVRVRSVGYDS